MNSISAMMLLACILLLVTPTLGLRALDRLEVVESDIDVSEPITISLTMDREGKRSVMDHYFTRWFGGMGDYMMKDEFFTGLVADKLAEILPEKMEEMGLTVTVTKHGIQGLTVIMSIVIQEIKDLTTILAKSRKEDGEKFAAALLSLEPILTRLGMPEKFEGIKLKIAQRIRTQLAHVLPGVLQEKLAEMFISSSVQLWPTPEPEVEEPKPEQLPAVREVIFWVNIEGRGTVAQAAGGLQGFAVRQMSNPAFLKVIREKLEEQVPTAIAEKVGSAMQLSFKTLDDIDAGSASRRTSFWVIATLNDMDISELLKKAKGEDFADAFLALVSVLTQLHELGVEQMGSELQRIQDGLDQKVLGNVRGKLAAAITEKLGGVARAVDKDEYEALSNFTAQWAGRCCTVEEATADAIGFYWVSQDLLRGPGLMGRSGRCPAIDAEKLCASIGQFGGKMMHRELVQSHFAPSMTCFPENYGLNAPVILKRC